jgi:hypothetical protein
MPTRKIMRTSEKFRRVIAANYATIQAGRRSTP